MLHLEYLTIPDIGVYDDNMFDIEMMALKEDDGKKEDLKQKIVSDKYIKYIVDAIEHAAGSGCDYDS